MGVQMKHFGARTRVTFLLEGPRDNHRALLTNFFPMCAAVNPDLVQSLSKDNTGILVLFNDVSPGAGFPIGALRLVPDECSKWMVTYATSDHVPTSHKSVDLGRVIISLSAAEHGGTEFCIEFGTENLSKLPGLASRIPTLIVRKLVQRVKEFVTKELIPLNVVDSSSG